MKMHTRIRLDFSGLFTQIREVLYSAPIAEIWALELEQLMNDHGYYIKRKIHWYMDVVSYSATLEGSRPAKTFISGFSSDLNWQIIPYLELWKQIQKEEKLDEVLFGWEHFY